MTAEEIADFVGRFGEVTEEQPFGPDVDVYKVAGKMFLIAAPGAEPQSVSLKCDPDLAEELRASYPAVVAGYHLNKRLWNTVELDGTVSDDLLRSMIAHSYQQVVAGLRLADRRRVEVAPRPPTTPLEDY